MRTARESWTVVASRAKQVGDGGQCRALVELWESSLSCRRQRQALGESAPERRVLGLLTLLCLLLSFSPTSPSLILQPLSLLHPVVPTLSRNVHRCWTQKVHHLYLRRPCHRCPRRKQHPPQQGRFPVNVPLPAMLCPPCSLDAGPRVSTLFRSFCIPRCTLVSSFDRSSHSALGLLCPRRPPLLPP